MGPGGLRALGAAFWGGFRVDLGRIWGAPPIHTHTARGPAGGGVGEATGPGSCPPAASPRF